MPVKDCTVDGQPGKRWGDAGKCYACGSDCTEATKKATAQGVAIGDIPPHATVVSPGAATSARIVAERALARQVDAAVAAFLREVQADALAALASPVLLAAARRRKEPFTLGAVDRHWAALIERVVAAHGTIFEPTIEASHALAARLRSDPLPVATFDAVRDTLLRGQAEKWTQRKVRAEMRKVITHGQTHADRIARTEATAGFNEAQMVGIAADPAIGQKTWVATMDARTRPWHAEANGQTVAANAAFDVGGEALMYPGDPNGSVENVANCRCCVVGMMGE